MHKINKIWQDNIHTTGLPTLTHLTLLAHNCAGEEGEVKEEG
jgi:hypothetical protein